MTDDTTAPISSKLKLSRDRKSLTSFYGFSFYGRETTQNITVFMFLHCVVASNATNLIVYINPIAGVFCSLQ